MEESGWIESTRDRGTNRDGATARPCDTSRLQNRYPDVVTVPPIEPYRRNATIFSPRATPRPRPRSATRLAPPRRTTTRGSLPSPAASCLHARLHLHLPSPPRRAAPPSNPTPNHPPHPARRRSDRPTNQPQRTPREGNRSGDVGAGGIRPRGSMSLASHAPSRRARIA
ncbi:hypothetical protein DAI22_03g323350 [Oryza sativa Japonica Group]|nr:hypothetical protein DAI22_03g323350 [Oryza sativa Japonica Group]